MNFFLQIRNSDIDILCLQEVYFADVQRQIYRALQDTYPYIFTAADLTADDSDPTRACTLSELLTIGICLITHCAGLERVEMFACIINK